MISYHNNILLTISSQYIYCINIPDNIYIYWQAILDYIYFRYWGHIHVIVHNFLWIITIIIIHIIVIIIKHNDLVTKYITIIHMLNIHY